MSNLRTGPSLDQLRAYELAVEELIDATNQLRPSIEALKAHERGSELYLDAATEVGIAASLVQVKAASVERLNDEIIESLPE
jgi:hypothetical protein